MKILQVVHGFPPEQIGGTELYTLAISRGLLDRGYRCHVLAGSDQISRGSPIRSGEEQGIPVTRVAGFGRQAGRWFPAYDPEVEDHVRGYLDSLRPEVVHIQHWVSLTANLIALCSEMRCPTVVTLHDLAVICPRGDRLRCDKVFCTEPLSTAPCLTCVPREPWQSDQEVQGELGLRQQMVEQGIHLADRLLVPSAAQKDFLARNLDIAADRLEVLPHGTLHDLKRGRGPQKPAGQGPLRLGHWGHSMWQKGTHLLLEAVRKLSDPGAVEVHVIGEAEDPAYREELAALARNLPVTFHGAFTPNDLAGLELDVAVFPSLFHESYSFVLDEAFQLGLPVIVSDRGAMAERVGPAGLVFSAGVVEDLTEKIQTLLDEPPLLEKLRTAIPQDPPHPMSEHLLALERIYGKVIRSRKKTSVPRPDYLKILIMRQRQLAERDAAIVQEQLRFQQLRAEAQEYQAHLEGELAKAQAAYRQLDAQAREYQTRLERDLERAQAEAQQYQAHLEGELAKAQAEYQQLYTEARQYQARLERDLEKAQAEAQQYQAHLEQELAKAQAEYQQLSTEAREYQARLEQDLEKAQADYEQLQATHQQLHAQAQEYQGRLERQLENAKAEYEKLHSEAQEYQGQLEGQLTRAQADYRQLDTELRQEIRTISEERDQLRRAIEWHLSHRLVRLYLRAWKVFSGSPEE